MIGFMKIVPANKVKVGDIITQPFPMKVQRIISEFTEPSKVEYIRFECVVNYDSYNGAYYYGLLSHNPVVIIREN